MDVPKTTCNHEKKQTASCVKIVPIFNTLSEGEMKKVESHAQARQYKKGEILFFDGDIIDQLMIIHRGKLKQSHLLESGEEHVYRILSVGDFIGEYAIFEESKSEGLVEALEETEICVIPREEIQLLVAEYPVIALKLLKELSHRLKSTENLVNLLQMQNIDQRVATVLLQLLKNTSVEGEMIVTLEIRKGDLASYLGITPESLSRKLSSFQREGWIHLKGQREIHIKNKDALLQIAGGE